MLLLPKCRLPSKLPAKICTATPTLPVLLTQLLEHSLVLVPPPSLLVTTSRTLTSKRSSSSPHLIKGGLALWVLAHLFVSLRTALPSVPDPPLLTSF